MHKESTALPLAREDLQPVSSGATGQQDLVLQHLRLPRAPLSLPRLLPERRIWPMDFVRFLSSVICRKENSCRSRVPGAVQQQDQPDDAERGEQDT